MLTRLQLSGWSLQATSGSHPVGPIAATVPGSVHTDLLRVGAIPDPFLDANELAVSWVSRADWHYRATVPAVEKPGQRVDLVFEGLDTVATVAANGIELGRSRNMHRSYRYDVTTFAAAGLDLTVDLTSPYTEAEAVRAQVGPLTNAYPEPFQYVRKMACSFGWDWGPTLPGAGIWREVRLETWSVARLAQVRPTVAVAENGGGTVTVALEVERLDDRPLTAELTVVDGEVDRTVAVPVTGSVARLSLSVPEPRLWWPHTLGGQPLYPVRVRLLDGAEPLDEWERRCGFRTVTVDRSPDEYGTRFTFQINGIDIFARGYNWIPQDVFPGTMTAQRYREALSEAVNSHADLVRVWGGGIYESREFYECCDELGLLVWQDFLFACAAYPEDEPIASEVIAEARENVVRLMPHPSLVLWNGNNENLWLCAEERWPERESGIGWGETYYLSVLPQIVEELDPSRVYTAGSPWSGSLELDPNDPNHQTMHSWNVWNRQDYNHYRDSTPRFMAEFGWQAPPTFATLRRSVSDDPLLPDSPGVLQHQKASDGQLKLNRGLADHFRVPADLDTWHYLTQLNQSRAIATGVEYWRSRWPRTAGTVLWQLNDLWPVTSWAAVDGDGRRKPLYHTMIGLYSDVLLSIQPDPLRAVLSNLSSAGLTGELLVRRVDVSGQALAQQRAELTAGPRAVAQLRLDPAVTKFGDPSTEFLVAEFAGRRALWFALPDKYFRYPVADYAVQVAGSVVTVTARTLVRDLLLQADRIDPAAAADRGFCTLLPGESVRIRITGLATDLEPAALARPFVLTDLGSALAG